MSSGLIMTLAFIVSFFYTFISVPFTRMVAKKIGAVDVPKDSRRMHKTPTPRLGGLAIFFGFLVSILCFCQLNRQILGLLLGTLIIVVLGIFDDSRDLSAKFKFMIQIIAALIVVYVGDIRITIYTNPNIFSENSILTISSWISVPLTVIWIVAITNAVNLIDGLDGLAAGISTIAAASLVFIALLVGMPDIALLAIIIAGACFGFLPYNFSKKKSFLGDTGSTFLGFTLAVLSVQGAFKSYAVISFAVPLLILGLPIFDTSFAILRRIKEGRGIMTPDRGHIHHKLVDMGFSKKQAVFILYAFSLVLGLTAVILADYGALRALLVLICVLIFVFAGRFITSKGVILTNNDDDKQKDININLDDMKKETENGDEQN